jgi:CRP-like cAMP-binding protein
MHLVDFVSVSSTALAVSSSFASYPKDIVIRGTDTHVKSVLLPGSQTSPLGLKRQPSNIVVFSPSHGYFCNSSIQAVGDIFAESDYGNSVYVVQDGMIDIINNTADGEIVLGTLEKGGIFGQMVLIDDQPRLVTARAVTVVTIIVVSMDVFNWKLAKCDLFLRGFLGIFVKNIRSMMNKKIGAYIEQSTAIFSWYRRDDSTDIEINL